MPTSQASSGYTNCQLPLVAGFEDHQNQGREEQDIDQAGSNRKPLTQPGEFLHLDRPLPARVPAAGEFAQEHQRSTAGRLDQPMERGDCSQVDDEAGPNPEIVECDCTIARRYSYDAEYGQSVQEAFTEFRGGGVMSACNGLGLGSAEASHLSGIDGVEHQRTKPNHRGQDMQKNGGLITEAVHELDRSAVVFPIR